MNIGKPQYRPSAATELARQRSQWDSSPGLRAHFDSFETFMNKGGIAGFYGPNGPIQTQAKIREEKAAALGAKSAELTARWDSNILVRNLYGTFEAFRDANEATEVAISNGRLKK